MGNDRSKTLYRESSKTSDKPVVHAVDGLSVHIRPVMPESAPHGAGDVHELMDYGLHLLLLAKPVEMLGYHLDCVVPLHPQRKLHYL